MYIAITGSKNNKDVVCSLDNINYKNIDECTFNLKKGEYNLYLRKNDKVIKEKITNNMPTREKIKVIHDYIIDNAEYDKLKYENKNDKGYFFGVP